MKYFLTSDIHGYFDELITALKLQNFNATTDCLIVVGDIFDRGKQAVQVYNFLKNLPHKILIMGNHDYRLVEIANGAKVENVDISNGTVDTIFQLTGLLPVQIRMRIPELKERLKKYSDFIQENCVNYIETDKNIVCHGWIPITIQEWIDDKSNTEYSYYLFNPAWEKATDEEWIDATWTNSYKAYQSFLFPNKQLIIGHFFASYFNKDKSDNIFISDKLIALDSCVMLSHKINILELEEPEYINIHYRKSNKIDLIRKTL